ncbi:MAG TPA: glycosyltransferase family 39 protein [Dehalococcoidia bacterium]|nr:glycosyltransferase family 39 protein [Dehalococcoidia bacterium]
MSTITSEPVRHKFLYHKFIYSETGRIRALFWPGTITAVVIGIGLAYCIWYGLTQRSVSGDDGISILAAQGILEHGYPRLASGFIYYRGFIPNYLVAAAIWALGLNDFAIMLPSLLMAAGSSILAYLFARDVLGRPLIGLLSAALLLTLDAQLFYASSPRMYMGLQFFTILAAYSGWRGYIRGEVKFQWVTLIAIAGAFLSQEQGEAILVAVPAAIIAIRWFQGENRVPLNYSLPIFSLLVLWTAVGFLHFFPLPDGLPAIAAHSGAERDVVGINTDIYVWAKHVGWLERTVPFGVMLSPVLAVLLFRAFRERHTQQGQSFIYAATILILCALAIATVIQTSQSRFWLFLVPIYVTVLWLGVFELVKYLKEPRSGQAVPFWRKRYLVVSGLVGWAIIVFFIVHFAYFRLAYLELVAEAYGWPCASPTAECSIVVKNQYAALKPVVKDTDLIIASNPWVTNYYLGRVDAYYRERIENKTFTTFDSPTDEYLGISFVDSPQKIRDLANSQRRVWILSDFKSRLFVSEASRNLVQETFDIYDEGTVMTIYVNHLTDSDTGPSR